MQMRDLLLEYGIWLLCFDVGYGEIDVFVRGNYAVSHHAEIGFPDDGSTEYILNVMQILREVRSTDRI